MCYLQRLLTVDKWKQMSEDQFGLLCYNTAGTCHPRKTISTFSSIILHSRH